MRVRNLHRLCLTLLAVVGLWAAPAMAEEKPQITGWKDLIINGVYGDLEKGVKEDWSQLHGIRYVPEYFPVNKALNGKLIKMPGYMVPMEYDADEIREFMLAPFLGACVHVPPPPPNQLVYVTIKKTMHFEDLYKPVWVIGRMSTDAKDSELAYAGYTLTATSVEPYETDQDVNIRSVH